MSLRNSFPIPWKPRGLSDTLYSGTSFPGAMTYLTNLVPDPTSTDLWQCRPAAAVNADPDGDFPDPGFVSVIMLSGTRLYGMMATSTNPGNDEPFCFDLITQTYIAISGVLAANTPVSPAVTGAWQPPHMEVVGTYVVVTHPGFTGSGGAFFGLIDIADPNALTWTATNTATNALPAVPAWVAQYNGRACFFVNEALYLSDSLDPMTVTNADQILTFGDNVDITCGAGLPLNNQLGGIIQSLIVFKGASNLYQVTGDYASDAGLSINSLNVATGTLAPNSLASTPYGLAFMSPEGLRVISFTATVSDPIGLGGMGITVPFAYAVTPSRMAAAYAGTVYRIGVQNAYAVDSPQQDYWYDFARKVWHGPHTFVPSIIVARNNMFLMTPIGDETGRIFSSETAQTTTSVFEEDGEDLVWQYRTPLFPNTDQMAQNAMVETTVYAAYANNNDMIVTAVDENGSVVDTVTLSPTGEASLWGVMVWGTDLWRGALNLLTDRQIPWTIPIVFQRTSIDVQGDSASGIKIGTLNLRYEQLGYLLPGS